MNERNAFLSVYLLFFVSVDLSDLKRGGRSHGFTCVKRSHPGTTDIQVEILTSRGRLQTVHMSVSKLNSRPQ